MPTPLREKIQRAIAGPALRRAALALLFACYLWNSRRYEIGDGYDYGGHRDYVASLAEKRALPTLEQTRMAYNPPVYYVFAAAHNWVINDLLGSHTKAHRFARVDQALLACLLAWMMMKFCGRLLGPGAEGPFVLALAAIPAFSRTVAMYTPEFMLSFWIWMALLVADRLWPRGAAMPAKAALAAAALLCLGVWTRPFGYAGVAGWGLTMGWFFLRDAGRRRVWFVSGLLLFVLCSVGAISLMAFNKHRFGQNIHGPQGLAPAKKRPADVEYFGVAPRELFTRPIRPSLGKRWAPILYSDFWGDYWTYWTANKRANLDMEFWGHALGVQNAFALVPSLLMAAGVVLLAWRGLRAPAGEPDARFVPLVFVAAVGIAFYFYFIFWFPDSDYDQVKATYISYLLPILPLGGAAIMKELLARPASRLFWLAPGLAAFWAWSLLGFGFYWH